MVSAPRAPPDKTHILECQPLGYSFAEGCNAMWGARLTPAPTGGHLEPGSRCGSIDNCAASCQDDGTASTMSIRLPEHPCTNHDNVRVPRAYGCHCAHAQAMITFVFAEHTVAEHPCPNHDNVRGPRAYGCQSIHAQTMITFVFREHTVARGTATRAKTPSPVQATSSADSFCGRPKVLEKEPLRNACFPIAKPLKTSEISDLLTLFAPCEKTPKRSEFAKTPVLSTFR